MNTPKELLSFFFKAPQASALLIFLHNHYKGILYKKDLESVRDETVIDIKEMIVPLHKDKIIDNIFSEKRTISNSTSIPIINLEGNFLRMLSYREFTLHFYPEKYNTMLPFSKIISKMDIPLITTDFFKKILYFNKKSEESFSIHIGDEISSLFKEFSFEFTKENLTLIKNKANVYQLSINHSTVDHCEYFLYFFLPLSH